MGKKREDPERQIMKTAVMEVVENKLSLRKAAYKYGISKSAIARSVKNYKAKQEGHPDYDFEYHPRYDIHKIFSLEQEIELRDYLILAAKHNYGLSKSEMKKLAYSYAVANKIEVPQWEEAKSAGEGWLRKFRNRHPNISLRKPEATSLARATAFNKTNVGEFFSKYQEILNRKQYQPHQIWNIDETGLSTVHVPPKILAPKGTKQVGNMTSAERGTTVTMIAAINAAGNSVPPLFVFPRVHFKQNMLKGAPLGSVGAANPSGWSNEEIFLLFIEHFIKHAQPSEENSHILILDNHESHYSPRVIARAKQVRLVIVTLPPHTSHKMQPLDRTVFGPFKAFYNKAMNDWMNSPNNAGRPVTLYDVAELAGVAYELSFTLRNITSGFKATGIVPLNSNIFDESDFIASSVTDRQLSENDNQEAGPSQLPSTACKITELDATAEMNTTPHAATTRVTTSVVEVVSTPTKSNIVTPEMIRPFLKAAPRKTVTRRRIGKSRIITDTPEEIQIKKDKESRKRSSTKSVQINKKRVTKKLWDDSSSDNDDADLKLDDGSDLDIADEIADYETEVSFEKEDIEEGDFVLVQCMGEKNKEHFVANILTKKINSFEVVYLKKMQKTDTFIAEESPNIYTLQLRDIIKKLPHPESVGSTKRSANHLKFGVDFSSYYMR